MRTEHATAFRLYTGLADAFAVAATWLTVTELRSWFGRAWPFDFFPDAKVLPNLYEPIHSRLTLAVVAVWMISLYFARAYEEATRRGNQALFLRLGKAVAIATPLLVFLLFTLQFDEWARTSRSVVGVFAVASVFSLYAERRLVWVVRRWWLADRADHRLVVVGAPEEAAPFLESLFRHPQWGIRVVGVVAPRGENVSQVLGVPTLGMLDQLPAVLEANGIDQVYMTGRTWDVATLRRVADACEEVGVRFSMDANFLGLSISRADLTLFEGWSVLTFSSTPTPSGALLVKRAMDVVLCGFALLALSPLLGLVALIIKLEDGGPVFFAQERCGLYGRRFPMYKFRSMVVDAEAKRKELEAANEMSGPVFKISRDPRITRIGAFIRKFSIDELPQLYNVLRGEMSIVGPRPPIPAEVVQYERWQMRRLSMRPGLTCIWQVSGRNNINFETWMQLDLEYIDNWSLLLDIKLILKTFPVVLLGTGAR